MIRNWLITRFFSNREKIHIKRRLFDATGVSKHNKRDKALKAVVDHCERNNIPHILIATPGKGYTVQRMDRIPRSLKFSCDGIS